MKKRFDNLRLNIKKYVKIKNTNIESSSFTSYKLDTAIKV